MVRYRRRVTMGVIVFLGDSITDADRINTESRLGDGYVSRFAASLLAENPDWRILNKGVDGHVTERVAATLHRDCIAYHPDYVSILVGINDVGLIAGSDALEQEKLYMLEDSIRAYHEMLFDLSRETSAAVLTLEPFIFAQGGLYEDWIPWQKKMSKNIQKLARNYHAKFIPLQEPLDKAVEEEGYFAITTDGIHLAETGEQILAEIVQKSFKL